MLNIQNMGTGLFLFGLNILSLSIKIIYLILFVYFLKISFEHFSQLKYLFQEENINETQIKFLTKINIFYLIISLLLLPMVPFLLMALASTTKMLPSHHTFRYILIATSSLSAFTFPLESLISFVSMLLLKKFNKFKTALLISYLPYLSIFGFVISTILLATICRESFSCN